MADQTDSDTPSATAPPVPAPDADVIMGFKRITPENFMLADLNRAFGLETHAQWIAWFNEVALQASVPEPVRRLFELARGSLIYGWLYYPLLTVGFDQCGRCLEAGVRHAAVPLLGCEPPQQQKIKYRSLIERMVKHGHILESDEPQWMSGLQSRNAAAHLTTPAIGSPGDARAALCITARQLNALFARVAALGSTPR